VTNKTGYVNAQELVAQAKLACHITTTNSEMTDDEIREAVRWIGQQTSDTIWDNGKPVFGKSGINLMLFVTLAEFAEFYERHGLSQFN